MYDKYLARIGEAGKLRNLREGSISCYKIYVSHFLAYVGKDPEELTCRDVRDFLLAKKDDGLKASTLNLYNSAIRFFYRYVLWRRRIYSLSELPFANLTKHIKC